MEQTTDGSFRPSPSLRASETYEGEPGSIAAARRLAARFLADSAGRLPVAMDAGVVDTVRLIVSELVTNAVKFAPGPCTVELAVTADRVTVSVSDRSTALPVVREPEPGRIGQHGLEIVRALGETFRAGREPHGKRVSVTVALRPAEVTGRDRGSGG